MDKLDIFFNKLAYMCNYNEKWLKLICQDLNYNEEDLVNCMVNEQQIVLSFKKNGYLEELKNEEMKPYPYNIFLAITISNEGVAYKKVITAENFEKKYHHFSQTTTINVKDDFQMEYKINEHTSIAYLPKKKEKPINRIIDVTVEEDWENLCQIETRCKKAIEVLNPNKEHKRSYNITKHTIRPIPYEDPNRNTYVNVVTENNRLFNGYKSHNVTDEWFLNEDKERKTFKFDTSKPLDHAIRNGITCKYLMKKIG